MIKLKNLLTETYAWQKRNADGSLPTLEDVQKEYKKKKAQEAVTDQEEEELKDIEVALKGASKKHKDQADKIGDIVKEVLKDKDGNVRTDLKYTDNQNYQPSIELKNTKMGSGGADAGGNEWGMEGSMAFHGELEDFDIDTLEKIEK
jgi:phosphate starvation-inducible protein PhoH